MRDISVPVVPARVWFVLAAVVAALIALQPVRSASAASVESGAYGYDQAYLRIPTSSAVPSVVREQSITPAGNSAAFARLGVAAKRLAPEIRALAEANLTTSGTTVLGKFPGYITKANSRGASYFDIGDAWNALSPAQRTAANRHFLDVIAERGDRVLLSVPKNPKVPFTGALGDEVAYLTGEKGYVWANQWSLRPGG